MLKSRLACVALVGCLFSASPIFAQTSTGWTLDGEKLAYVAGDGSGVFTVVCDPTSDALVISATTGPGNGWIHIATDAGAKIALPAPGHAINGAIEASLSVRDPFIDALAVSDHITISTAQGTGLSVNLPAAFERITTSCP